jgi:hypothetical protein
MNLSFPHLNIKKSSFIISTFIGIAPWNFFMCSAGSILFEIIDRNQIINPYKYALVKYYNNIFMFMFILYV